MRNIYHVGCEQNCYNQDAEKTEYKNVSFVYDREQLLYDIKNVAYIEAHKINDSEQQHSQHSIVDICEEGNIHRVDRVLFNEYCNIVEMLNPMTKQKIEEGEIFGNEIMEPEQYKIELTVPETMSRTTLKLLSVSIHDYLVACVIYDWLAIYNPAASANWINQVESLRNDINVHKNIRGGVLLRPSRPF